MDPTACNYDPLATVADTSCYYAGDPRCPNGPDLQLRRDVLYSSMYVSNYTSNDPCQVQEQCVTGLGTRELVNFTTHIENNGTLDYYVGVPSTSNPQFTNNNCHGHWHYEGYAEYVLFDMQGTRIPIGFKNGFCVMDLTCDHGGSAQYGCSNMGISAGCGDIYSAGLACQWIDVTTVPDGRYTFVARVNWDYSPDALGRYENDYHNNWGQVCVTLDRSSGSLQITKDTVNCPTYTDCTGTAFGTAQPDCAGTCNGTAVRGDLNSSTARDAVDVDFYLNYILADSAARECNDLHRDTVLNVYDAALLARCLYRPNQCNFPNGFVNIFDTVGVSIQNVDFANGYLDLYLHNAMAELNAYQLDLAGIEIDSVVNLATSGNFAPTFAHDANTIVCLAEDSSFINRAFSPQPLARVYFSNITANQICVSSVDVAVNRLYQRVMSRPTGACAQVVGTYAVEGRESLLEVTTAPNPASSQIRFGFKNRGADALRLRVYDSFGKLVHQSEALNSNDYILQRNALPAGIYFYQVGDDKNSRSGRFVFE